MSSLKILFHTSQLCLRGTEIAVYDYAQHNEALLGNQSVVCYNRQHPLNDPLAIERFSQRFEVIGYNHPEEINRIIQSQAMDVMYAIKGGKPDGIIASEIPTMVHAVFPTHPSYAHGSSYAYVSQWLAKTSSNHRLPFVPHIVSLPELNDSLRAELAIPEDAVVFGCHGGPDSVDIPFVYSVIKDLVNSNSRYYFLFLNINPFIQHPRVIFLPGTPDLQYKTAFINSCDAMLHARRKGESFGLACGEFSIRNKPIFTYTLSAQRNHLMVLRDRAFGYRNARELRQKLLSFDRETAQRQNWDCYSQDFSPEPVMTAFRARLIEPALLAGPAQQKTVKLNWNDQLALLQEAVHVRALSVRKRLHL